MWKSIYEELTGHNNVKENLSALRSQIKEPKIKAEVKKALGDGDWLVALLASEEPKIRKNAALLIGDLELQAALSKLFFAYTNEETLFVKSAYLTAMGKLDAAEYLDVLKERQRKLCAAKPLENEKKHIREEMRELEKIITGLEGIKKHTFVGFTNPHELILTANKEQRQITAEEVQRLPAGIQRKMGQHPLGVLVYTKQITPFLKLRTYRELLFPIAGAKKLSLQPREAAGAIAASGLTDFLKECHKNQDGPFYFRLELKSKMDLAAKTAFAKKFAAELEDLTARGLVNSTKDYEIEIRLVETKEGNFLPFVKLYTIPMKRFAYRKNAISTSIHPANAAAVMAAARPYLKEEAQILDPFCGVGTMLIERDICVPAREKYGIDIFGDAIVMARENAALAGEQINFIHRDYFDFKHSYKFDEIITNMPMRGRKTREEQDAFYGEFFRKSRSILAEDGIIIMYSNEQGFIKKHLRLNPDYKLLQEFCMREKDQFYLFIIGVKG
jgi:23S rRNA G2445 N2-methylase RlmL